MTIKETVCALGTLLTKVVCATCFMLVVVGGTHLYTKHQMELTLRATHEANVRQEQAKRYGRESAEFHLLVQAILEECGGVPEEWTLCFEAKIGRVDSDLFPDTIETVLKQPGAREGSCQFSYLCDDVHPHVVTEQGDAIREFLAPRWQAYLAGTYEYQYPEVHSFCVLASCVASVAYFGQFEIMHVANGHVYLGGPVRGNDAIEAAKVVFAELLQAQNASSLAVKTSPRPAPRLERTGLTIDDAVSLALEF